MITKSLLAWLLVLLLLPDVSHAQRPPRRQHRSTKTKTLRLADAIRKSRYKNKVQITESDGERVFQVNSIPEHKVGSFPNGGNPHAIKEVEKTYRVTMAPQKNVNPTRLGMGNFGIGLNGVVFDPGAAEFWLGNPKNGWRYEALSGAVSLGLDVNYGHVQPDGKYHYHGLPVGLLKSLEISKTKHSPLVGWAADGFPIYAIYGYTDPADANSPIKRIRSSYRLIAGDRPGGELGTIDAPHGKHDGTFVNDYECVQGLGDLDECSTRFTVTPEYPDGTHAYFLTEDWPVVPRLFRGTPDKSFEKQLGPPQHRGHRSPPPRRQGFPPRRSGKR